MIRTLLTCFFLTFFVSTSIAGDWRVIPVRLFLGPQIKNDSVRLINSDSAPLNLQLKATIWTQNEQGEDIYEETEDIVFFPRVMSIPPGEERLLRAGYKFPAISKEKTYRLFIEEIPASKPDQGAAVMVAVRFGLPIFVAPPNQEKSINIDKVAVVKGLFTADVSNIGNSHVLPVKLSIAGKNNVGKPTFSHDISPWYILTGNQRSFTKKLTDLECSNSTSIHFEFVSNTIRLTEDIPLSKSNCQH